jgi:hypothetical protein
MITPLGGKTAPALRVAPEKAPLGVARRSFGMTKLHYSRRAGLHPKEIKRVFQESWATSDNHKAFAQALLSKGFVLARGDRHGYVALDYRGEVYAVARYAGVKTKDVRKRLGDPKELPSIEQAKGQISADMTERLRQHLTHAEKSKQRRSAALEFKRLRQRSEIHTHELEIELLRQDIRDYDSMRTDKHSKLREEYRETLETPERPRRAKEDQDREEDRGYEPEI